MECDLSRLNLAIDSANRRWSDEWKTRFRIAGHKVDEPDEEAADDDEFNEQARAALANLKRRAA